MSEEMKHFLEQKVTEAEIRIGSKLNKIPTAADAPMDAAPSGDA
jgi:hypothetical protein